MDVFISADIEGITGLVSWTQCAGPDEEAADWSFAREMMTHDVNAAIRGARKGGASRIVVKDSHADGKNLLVAELESGAQLISGSGCRTHDVMMEGIDSTFGAAFLVGYHARAGTGVAIMDHTISGKVHRLWLNGSEIGEIALSAGTAGRYGVPVVLVCSDRAGCAEAVELMPGVRTAAVKDGLGKSMGKCLHPDQTADLIEKAAADAVRHAGSIKPWQPDPPLLVSMEFKGEDQADYASRLVGASRVGGYTVEFECGSYEDAHRAVISMIIMAGAASDE